MEKVVTNDAHSILLSTFFFQRLGIHIFLLLCQWHRFMSTFLALHGSLPESVFFFFFVSIWCRPVCIHDAAATAARMTRPNEKD